MKPVAAVYALLACVLVALPTPAAPCQTGVCPTPVVTAPVVVAPLAVTFPLYGAGYVGNTSTDDETKELLRQLLTEIKALRDDVKSIQPSAGGDVPPLGAAAKVDVFEVLKKNCVSCHSGDKPRGDFALMNSDGKFLRLSPADRRSILNRIDGKGGSVMPPADKKPLTAPEKAALKGALSDVPANPAGKK